MFALQTMGEMIESYRHDILRWRQEYKKLRDQESNQELVNLHIRHRMAEIQKSIGNGIEAWSALRADYFVQRACIMGRKNKKA
ncbi:MAG: hypothetical protein DYH13_10915 [Alphaproteobacteria bacterium PRO2]|nr:hypothetical protein [Alphaproteobacteria bacterium PRO2]